MKDMIKLREATISETEDNGNSLFRRVCLQSKAKEPIRGDFPKAT